MKLIIAIPTYNRAPYLARSVRSIASQVPKVMAELSVELIIYDNASSDDTVNLCDELKIDFPFIKVVRHNENIGGDANILHAIQSSDADYTWVFGDDDYLFENALSIICNLLIESNCCLLKLSAIEDRDIGEGDLGSARRLLNETNLGCIKYRTFTSADEVLMKFGLGMGNFTSLIISNAFFNANYALSSEEFFSSGYSQLDWIYKGLAKSISEFGFVEQPVLAIRIELKPRGLSADKINAGIHLLQKSLLEFGYSKDSVDAFQRCQRNASYLDFIKQEKICGRSSSLKYLLFSSSGISFLVLIKAIIISLLPCSFFVWIWHYKKTN